MDFSDGYIYVGTLAHEEFGAARVFKVSQSGQIVGFIGRDAGALLRTDRGLTTIVGLDVARNGDIYVSELFAGDDPEGIPGKLTKIDGRTGRTSSWAPQASTSGIPSGRGVVSWVVRAAVVIASRRVSCRTRPAGGGSVGPSGPSRRITAWKCTSPRRWYSATLA